MHSSVYIIADESVDFRIVHSLRQNGLTVIAICETSPSITDKEVLELTLVHKALILTEDKDFGELVFRLQMPHHGILLIRFEDNSFKIESTVKMIQNHLSELLNKFSVLTKDRLRIREL